jgi:hypothetical protein
MRSIKIILATGAVALAVPGVASAHHGAGAADPAGHHGTCSGHHQHGFRHHARGFAGTVVSTDAAAKTVTVSVGRVSARHHGGSATPKQVTLDVSKAKIRAADTDGDGTKDELADVRTGDKILVKAAKGAKGANPVPVKWLVDWTTTKPAAKHRR